MGKAMFIHYGNSVKLSLKHNLRGAVVMPHRTQDDEHTRALLKKAPSCSYTASPPPPIKGYADLGTEYESVKAILYQ
ncbi:hypothetical protein Vi05172_g9208 [Venturia inaequalis]|nr:hypothetical protein Vi05172_g9208 [Venturia inaequalis]